MFKKVLLFFVLLFLLSGCNSTNIEGQTVQFDQYSIKISNQFKPVDLLIFKNKRTEGKIFKAFELPNETDDVDVFEKNITFSALPNKQNLDSKTFANLAKTTLQKTFPNYKQIDFFYKTIKCPDKTKINVYINSFSYNQFDILSGTYYNTQLYFADPKFLYTITAISKDQEDVATYEEYFKTIKCIGK